MTREFFVSTVEEAATEGYDQGFAEGYEAARLTVEAVVKAWRKEPLRYDLEGALQALDMSRDKAREMLGRPKVIASKLHVPDGTDRNYQ